MGGLARSTTPGVDLGTGVGLRSTAQAAMATGEAALLAAVQPASASSATLLLTVGGDATRVLLAVRTGAGAADDPAGVVARALAGTPTAVQPVATR